MPSELLDLTDDLRGEIHASLKGPLEEWCKCNLNPTFVYGIRDYKEGAVLIPHRDRENTHIISAIINIAKDIIVNAPINATLKLLKAVYKTPLTLFKDSRLTLAINQ